MNNLSDRFKFAVKFSLLALVLFFALASFNATPVQAQDQLVFGYAAPSLADQFQVVAQKTFVKKAEELGIKVITTDAGRDAQKQIEDIEDLIARGVDAICTVPANSKAVSVAVQQANKQNVPVFTIDRGVTEGKVVMTVLARNYLAGVQNGEVAVRLLQGKYDGTIEGKVLHITGKTGQNVTQLRKNGFDSVVKEYPNIEMITKAGDWSPETGFNVVQDVLSSNPNLDIIYHHSDLYIPGTIEAIRSVKGSYPKVGEEGHIFLLSIDGASAMLEKIGQGLADGTAVQPVTSYGEIIVPFMKEYVEEGESALPEPGSLIKEEGAPWSPARVEETQHGLEVALSTSYADSHNAGNNYFWGNRESK